MRSNRRDSAGDAAAKISKAISLESSSKQICRPAPRAY